MENLIEISVVIATHNRSDLLIKVLNSLKEQDFDSTKFEVIVACDGCSDNTLDVLQELKSNILNLQYLDLPKGNPAKARNAGISHSKGRIIAFTDDDCIVSNNWLTTIYQTFNTSKAIGIQGKTTTNKKETSPLTHQIENLNGHDAVPTCNAAFLKEALIKVGMFDEDFPYAHNEDADLAWRIRKEGELTFIPEMVIDHPPRKVTFRSTITRMKILESEFMLFHKNPVLYKFWRNETPWKTIYNEVFIKHQMLLLKSRLRFSNRPLLLLAGIGINICWWLDLILKYPKFSKADKYYKEKYSRENVKDATNMAA